MSTNTVRGTTTLAAVCLLAGCGTFGDRSRLEAGRSSYEITHRLNSVTDGLSAAESCVAERLSSLQTAKPTLLLIGPWTAVKPALEEAKTYFIQTVKRVAPKQYRVSETENANLGIGGYIIGSPMVWAPTKLTKEQVEITLERNDVSAMVLVTATVLTDQALSSYDYGLVGGLGYQGERRGGKGGPRSALDVERSGGRTWDSMNMTANVSEFNSETGADFIARTFEVQAVRRQGSNSSALTVGFSDALTLTVGGVFDRRQSEALITGVQRQLTRMAALEFLRRQFPQIPLQGCFDERLDSPTLADKKVGSGRAGDDGKSSLREFPPEAQPIAEFLVSLHLLHPQAKSRADLLKAVNRFEYLVNELPTLSLETPELVQLRLEALEQRFHSRLALYRQASQVDLVVSESSVSLNIDVTDWRQGRLDFTVHDREGAVIAEKSFDLPSDRDQHTIAWISHPSSRMNITLADGPVAVRHWEIATSPITNRRSGL